MNEIKNPQKIKIKSNLFWRTLPSGMKRRWWLFRVVDLVAFYFPVIKKREGMAVVRMDGIGDMVLFRNYLSYYEGVYGIEKKGITVIGCKSWSSLVSEMFPEYKAFTIDEHLYSKRMVYRFYVNLRVRMIAPKIVVSDSYFRRALISDSLVWVMNAPFSSVSYPYISESNRAEFTYYLSSVSQVIDTGPYPTHELIRHANFLSSSGSRVVVPSSPKFSWRRSKSLPAKIGREPYVVLASGSNEAGRRWPLENFVKLAKTFTAEGYAVVFTGKGDHKIIENNIKDANLQEKTINLVDKTKLPELLDLIAQASLVVSNDTGPGHLSIGLGAPTIIIVGGGHFGSFVPYPRSLTPNNVKFLYKKLDCYHCFWRCDKRENSSQSFPCIAQISIERVKTACKEIIGKPASYE